MLNKIQNLNYLLIFLVILISFIGAAGLYSAAGGNLEPWAISQLKRFMGVWESRQFTEYSQEWQLGQGTQPLYFSNLMEYENGTHPLDEDSDDDSVAMKPVFVNGIVDSYVRDGNLSDGREIFKYGTNPLDNDTDVRAPFR